MSRNAWAEAIEQTQLVIGESPDYCFVCGELVPDNAPEALLQAYLDAGHRDRIAVVCGRRACRLALQDATNGTWQRFFDALTHWPDRAIYPHGPYWVIRRPHQLTFRTAPRRTTVRTAVSPTDPDDAASLPSLPSPPAPTRPLIEVQPRPCAILGRIGRAASHPVALTTNNRGGPGTTPGPPRRAGLVCLSLRTPAGLLAELVDELGDVGLRPVSRAATWPSNFKKAGG